MLVENRDFFIHTPFYIIKLRERLEIVFGYFSKPRQIPGLPGGVNTVYKNPCFYPHL